MRYKKGFSLVELISVIAVLTVITAMGMPTFLIILNRAKAQVCQSNLKTINNLYVYDSTAKGNLTEHDQIIIMEQAIAELCHSDTYSSDDISLCPKKGMYTITYNNFTKRPEVSCSYHNDFIGKAHLYITAGLGADENNNAIVEYLQHRHNNDFIVSTENVEQVNQIKSNLFNKNYNIEGCTWQVVKAEGRLIYFYCPEDIGKYHNGDEIKNILRYDPAIDTYFTGKAQVKVAKNENGTYNYLDVAYGDWTKTSPETKESTSTTESKEGK